MGGLARGLFGAPLAEESFTNLPSRRISTETLRTLSLHCSILKSSSGQQGSRKSFDQPGSTSDFASLLASDFASVFASDLLSDFSLRTIPHRSGTRKSGVPTQRIGRIHWIALTYGPHACRKRAKAAEGSAWNRSQVLFPSLNSIDLEHSNSEKAPSQSWCPAHH